MQNPSHVLMVRAGNQAPALFSLLFAHLGLAFTPRRRSRRQRPHAITVSWFLVPTPQGHSSVRRPPFAVCSRAASFGSVIHYKRPLLVLHTLALCDPPGSFPTTLPASSSLYIGSWVSPSRHPGKTLVRPPTSLLLDDDHLENLPFPPSFSRPCARRYTSRSSARRTLPLRYENRTGYGVKVPA